MKNLKYPLDSDSENTQFWLGLGFFIVQAMVIVLLIVGGVRLAFADDQMKTTATMTPEFYTSEFIDESISYPVPIWVLTIEEADKILIRVKELQDKLEKQSNELDEIIQKLNAQLTANGPNEE